MKPTPRSTKVFVLVLLITFVLYGVSYQQFRHFDIDDARGGSDASVYIAMSHGDYDVSPVGRYRVFIPFAASMVRAPLGRFVRDVDELDKLSFYAVNFVIAAATAMLLLAILEKLGFNWQLSLVGTILFLCSRTTVLSVGVPLVDSLYYFAIAVIVYLTVFERPTVLAILAPLLILSKETIVPFLFLPLFSAKMRSKRMFCSIVVSFLVFFLFRHLLAAGVQAGENPSFADIVITSSRSLGLHTRETLSLKGMHDLANGFTFLLVFAAGGFIVNSRKGRYNIPRYFWLMIPIALGFAVLSGNFGRMFFSAYIVVIAYALIFLEDCVAPNENSATNVGNDNPALVNR